MSKLKPITLYPRAAPISSVRKFHETFGHPAPGVIDVSDPKLRKLRVDLLAEELLEFAKASGVELVLRKTLVQSKIGVEYQAVFETKLIPDAVPDVVEMADGLGDILYVAHGANIAYGFPGVAIFNEIHESNMSKAGEDGKPVVREDGKIMKGPNYHKPRIKEVLDEWEKSLPCRPDDWYQGF